MVSERILGLRAIDAANAELIARNAIRLQEAKEKMGTKYLLHPANKATKAKFQSTMRIQAKQTK